jgi:amidohydrolase
MTDTPHADLVPQELRNTLLSLRRDLHRDPELSLEETRTAERLEGALDGIKPKLMRRVAGTGIIARVRGRNPDGPIVAIRGDIDALPVHEETGVDFASQTKGVMHACGHDVHAAWTVGAAHLLTDNPAEGDVLVVLQPAEETAQGALAILEAGELDGVAAIVGAHVDMRYPLGTVVAQKGHMAASADEFVVKLTGAGSHAARPHEGINPILGAATLVSALQTVVLRNVPPGTPAVLTVATFNAGTASNVIPDVATITGTVRAVDSATRSILHREITSVADAIGAAFGLTVNVGFLAGTPPLVNAAASVAWVREAARTLLGQDALVPLAEPNLGGEDFAFYLERLPGCFFRVGGRASGQEVIPAHSSRFLPADDAVVVGAAVLAETARVASRALRRKNN